MPEGIPRVTTIALDLRVLAVATFLSLVTGILFGIFPAHSPVQARSVERAERAVRERAQASSLSVSVARWLSLRWRSPWSYSSARRSSSAALSR